MTLDEKITKAENLSIFSDKVGELFDGIGYPIGKACRANQVVGDGLLAIQDLALEARAEAITAIEDVQGEIQKVYEKVQDATRLLSSIGLDAHDKADAFSGLEKAADSLGELVKGFDDQKIGIKTCESFIGTASDIERDERETAKVYNVASNRFE